MEMEIFLLQGFLLAFKKSSQLFRTSPKIPKENRDESEKEKLISFCNKKTQFLIKISKSFYNFSTRL